MAGRALVRQLLRCCSSGVAQACGFSCSEARWAAYSSAAAAPQPQQHQPSYVAGQPTWHTHPELLRPSELQPGITTDELGQRRQRLCQAMGSGSLAIVPAASIVYMSGVIPYVYRQDPDCFYLTGLNQPALAVLQVPPGGFFSSSGAPQARYTLFIDPPNAERERWTGATLDKAAARQVRAARRPARQANVAAARPPYAPPDSFWPGGPAFSCLLGSRHPAGAPQAPPPAER